MKSHNSVRAFRIPEFFISGIPILPGILYKISGDLPEI